jgi:hypothetical protein
MAAGALAVRPLIKPEDFNALYRPFERLIPLKELPEGETRVDQYCGGESPDRYDSEYESAIKRSCASFTQVAETWFRQQEKYTCDPELRKKSREYYPKLLDAYEECHGGISELYWCTHLRAGVCLTSEGDLDIVDDLLATDAEGASKIQELIGDCQQLKLRVETSLPGKRFGRIRQQAMRSIYNVLTEALGMGELVTSTGMYDQGMMTALRKRYEKADEFATTNGRRRAALIYFGGMIFGLVILFPLAIWGLSLVMQTYLPKNRPDDLVASFITGGAAGAFVVMTRISFARLSVDEMSGWPQLFLLGAIRPTVGAGLGVGLFLLSVANMIPIRRPPDVDGSVFYPTLAGLAGSSEQLAMSAFGSARNTLILRLQPKVNKGGDAG